MGLTELLVAILGGGGAMSVVVELIRINRTRKKDAFEFQQEKTQAPQVKESLLLNNTEKAVLIQQSLIDQLQEELNRSRKDIQDFREQLREKDKRIEELTTRVTSLMEELQDIHGQLKGMRTEIDDTHKG